MPKIKTHSGAKKRFSVTGSGKVKFQHTNKRHRLTQKDESRRREISESFGSQEFQQLLK